MKAFQASVEHTNTCPPCQNDNPCPTGDPIHQDFRTKQDSYEQR
jgi:hypothetical protein